MDDEDHYSASSAESDHDNDNDNDNDNEQDGDEVMEDADDGDNDVEAEEDNNDDDEDEDVDNDDNDNDGDNDNDNDNDNEDIDNENENEIDRDKDTDAHMTEAGDSMHPSGSDNKTSGATDESSDKATTVKDEKSVDNDGDLTDRQREKQKASSASNSTDAGRSRPRVRPDALNARLYDIVPTMAAPQATSINAMAITPDLRYWFTGGSDGYIRKYDGPGTINGKLPLTVAQRHPFVDSVTKAGILMSYWENEEPSPPGRSDQDHILSPVYSLAVQHQALWLLSGLESGGINLQSVRHDEGKKIVCLQQHTNAVSVLNLAQDETSVLSGSWDKNIFDWDLNTGQVKRSFDGSGGQIAAIEVRPARGGPIPAGADDPLPSSTITTNNDAKPVNGAFANGNMFTASEAGVLGRTEPINADQQGQESPTHESLFGGSDAGSLFGESGAGQPFGHDEDEYHGSMGMMQSHEHEGGMDHSADMAMAGMEEAKQSEKGPALSTQPLASDNADSKPINTETLAPSSPLGPPVGSTHQDLPDGQFQQSDQQLQIGQEIKSEAHDDPGVHLTQDDQPQVSPALVTSDQSQEEMDPSQTSPHHFLSAAMDGHIRIWDRRVPNPVARIGNRPGVPPWCMSACWSPDGNRVYAGRRNGTVEEFDIRKAKRGWEPERVLKFPAGSGAVSALKPMVNGRHLVCASHDILRLYDLRDTRALKHSTVPFLIIPGPPRAGVISQLYIDPTSRFMLSAAGTRGWEGTSTEALIGYEINVTSG